MSRPLADASRSRLPLSNRTGASSLSTLKRDNPTLPLKTSIAQKKRRVDVLKENVGPSQKPRGNLRRSMSVDNLAVGNLALPKRNNFTSRTALSSDKTNKKIVPIKTETSKPAGKPKRAAWDYKGRLEDLETVVFEYRQENKTLSAATQEKEQQVERLLVDYHQTKEKAEEHETRVNKLEAELANTKTKIYNTERINIELEREKNLAEARVANLTGEMISITQEKEKLNLELSNTKIKLEKETSDNIINRKQIELLEAKVSELEVAVETKNHELISGEMERRNLHNQIQDLKGNIRVFCRVRPLTQKEAVNGSGCVSYPDPDMKAISLPSLRRESVLNDSAAFNSRQTQDFTFDKVFHPEDSQTQVYFEVSQFIQSVLDGYSVCIFAYGPTGSGKTFTMEGLVSEYEEDKIFMGIIPRAVHHIFDSIEKLKLKGWEYELTASFVEIYNEAIRDLLKINSDVKCEIRSKGNEQYISNVTTEEVRDKAVVLELIAKANKSRAVAATKCNERSSRSHSVFILQIVGKNATTHESCRATLNLVDLAGSERVKVSGSQGSRLEEAKSINMSLTHLGNVIMALAQKKKHIPFRNSKLTQLLSPHLGGKSKTLMFINISPAEEYYSQTVDALQFAKKVNECYVGVAQKKF